MKLMNAVFASGILLGLTYLASRVPSNEKREELLNIILKRGLASLKNTELVMEKSPSSHLREMATILNNELNDALNQLFDENNDEDNDLRAALKQQAYEYQFNYEYDEDAPFDNAYLEHQLPEMIKTLSELRQLAITSNEKLKEFTANLHKIFSRYYFALKNFEQHFLAIDEHRIRDFAHQIWESEGRPEGQAIRHWAMAVELSKTLTPAELQLAFEQKRSAVDLLSTTRFDITSNNDMIH